MNENELKSIERYFNKFNEDAASFNEFEANDFIKLLKNNGRNDDAIEVGNTFLQMAPSLKGYINQYGYALYNKFINIDDEKIKEKESLFFDILEDILGICKQEKYSPVEPAINRAIKYALNQTPINYDLMIKMLNKLDVKLLSDKPFVNNEGREFESFKERYFRLKVRALFETKQYKVCVECANQALATPLKWHYNALQWIKYYRGCALLELKEYDEANREFISFEEKVVEECGKEKIEIPLFELDEALVQEITDLCNDEMVAAVSIPGKLERYAAIDEIMDRVTAQYDEKEYADEETKESVMKQVGIILHDLEKNEVRRLITEEKIRPDGRKIDEVRPLNAQVDLLPRVHGSALFTRGETQVLSVCTLGAMGEVQKIDGLGLEDQKRFMHHYNFPPYSVGETGRMGAPGRREIGHGALGERALAQVIPSEKDFPYTIRVVSEVLESNGSSSQASICASSMALMAAGVPISNPVSGVAMGLVKKGDDYTILTDIQGMEDHLGDMDFKVAGTKNGICALQMDIKIDGITKEILQEALAQAKVGRAQIMDCMLGAIPAPRDHLSKYAPKMHVMHIDPEQIRDVIGRGGETINEIIEKSNDVKIDIDQDGTVVIYHSDQEAIDTAVSLIERIVKKAEVGEIYDGTIARVNDNYAFVTLFEGTDGFLHISDWSYERTSKMQDVCKVGDVIKVKVTKVDDKGKVNVSRKALLPKPVKKEEKTEKNEK